MCEKLQNKNVYILYSYIFTLAIYLFIHTIFIIH